MLFHRLYSAGCLAGCLAGWLGPAAWLDRGAGEVFRKIYTVSSLEDLAMGKHGVTRVGVGMGVGMLRGAGDSLA